MMEHNMMLENKPIEDDCHLKCQQYLISMFGEAAAEYFLSPCSCSKEIPTWFFQLKDDMKGMSAVSLWDALRQCSAQILQESNTEPSMAITNEIVRRVTDWKTLKKQDHLMHLSRVKYMFRCAQRNQAISALLLQHNPLFDYEINKGLN
ncbi:uncharacterized protein si:rp71-17i16.6 [Carassius gibelio]|uniref:uncharacterized protein si:rp71-17i16.6 n=1 Tax=Carassius gibelio TaxID=101364 RepID=UPI002277B5A4|nr:uncharacterized protein si:rp71-17i16.6 [Carassius gibelio]